MTTKEIDRNIKEIWKLFKETDKEIKKTGRQVEETGRQVKETSKKVDDLTGNWGKFVEGLIAPSVERLFKERGIEIERVYQRVKAHRNGKEMEVDILASNGGYGILIEAKTTLKVEDVREHIKRIKEFKYFFPEYKDKRLIGAVGGITIEEEADKYAYRQGLFVITQSGEMAKITNDRRFKPKVW